ncbi:hypothetical protein ACH5RR_036799 [Cinchona calisaya]|uniref:Glabrous enhancer-binding protein-like DBD domain-containing protein n=1 Tax=Cinchona calisaya TaxID=153742 RepID=A0ABD2Y832_9GENT
MAPKSHPCLPLKRSPSDSSPPPQKPDEEEEESQGDGDCQEDISEENEEENSRILPRSQHAAVQVEKKQITEEVIPPNLYPSASKSDHFDGAEFSKKNIPKRPKKGLKDGTRKSKRRRIILGNKKDPGLIGTRVFTEEDEVTILKGMIDFGQSQNVSDLSALSINAFHEFLKGKLHFDFTKTQIYEKVRRLKEKYLKNLKTNKKKRARKSEISEEGNNVSSKPHESEAFELSKRIWDGSDVNGESMTTDLKSGKKESDGKDNVVRNDDDEVNKVEDEEDDGVGFWSNYPFLKDSFDVKNAGLLWMPGSFSVFTRENMNLIESVRAKELEIKWKELLVEEIELFLKKLNWRTELMKLVLDAMKNG